MNFFFNMKRKNLCKERERKKLDDLDFPNSFNSIQVKIKSSSLSSMSTATLLVVVMLVRREKTTNNNNKQHALTTIMAR